MKYKKLKAKAAEYGGETIESIAVENYSKVREWMCDTTSRSEFDRMCKLCSDNRQTFRGIFGKPSFCWKGSEFYFRCYLLKFEGCLLLALTAKDKGTCYEAVTDFRGEKLDVDRLKLIEFLEWLAEQLPSLSK